MAFRVPGLNAEHIDNERSNNRAENSHLPRGQRERKCSGSSRQDRPKSFSIFSLSHTILSMFNATYSIEFTSSRSAMKLLMFGQLQATPPKNL
jgi:hypothetical protein